MSSTMKDRCELHNFLWPLCVICELPNTFRDKSTSTRTLSHHSPQNHFRSPITLTESCPWCGSHLSVPEKTLGLNPFYPHGSPGVAEWPQAHPQGGSFGPSCPFFTPGFCSERPQADQATDLPDTGWLKRDHTSGSPAFSLWKHEHDLLSSSSYPPEIQRTLSSRFSFQPHTKTSKKIWWLMV